ncbi:hypothetical protein EUGRSUZ_E04048 [Eucalyptus grandis]|uniref:Uncharacterized protein n=2 Tax=Eucalyptus grandis TaxID=71139 RepID=A0ACC3L023_EUCGR|nr:hypothetical protein EUGRSUZ_E04048 [Eucalyptus grandis]
MAMLFYEQNRLGNLYFGRFSFRTAEAVLVRSPSRLHHFSPLSPTILFFFFYGVLLLLHRHLIGLVMLSFENNILGMKLRTFLKPAISANCWTRKEVSFVFL